MHYCVRLLYMYTQKLVQTAELTWADRCAPTEKYFLVTCDCMCVWPFKVIQSHRLLYRSKQCDPSYISHRFRTPRIQGTSHSTPAWAPPIKRTPFEFRRQTYAAKIRRSELLFSEYRVILASVVYGNTLASQTTTTDDRLHMTTTVDRCIAL